MANSNPVQGEAFKAQQAPKYGDRALGKTIGVRFPIEVDGVLKDMDNRQEFIRQAVKEALLQKELM